MRRVFTLLAVAGVALALLGYVVEWIVGQPAGFAVTLAGVVFAAASVIAALVSDD